MIGELPALLGADEDRVESRPFFGADSRVNCLETVRIDGAEDIVEESDAIESLEFDDSEMRIEFVTDPSTGREIDHLLGLGIEVVNLLFKVF